MPKLFIVESPSKIPSISKYIGSDYLVAATVGHLVDLDPKCLSVDPDTMETKKITIRGKGKIVSNLKKQFISTGEVLLAGDPDREGEAICVQVANILGVSLKNTKRIKFNEITKGALLAALKNPTKIDLNLYDAQQTRRIIDRLVGYKVSPILSRGLGFKGLSAGRVQSVVLKFICDRYQQIENFQPKISSQITGCFEKIIKAKLPAKDTKTFDQAKELIKSAQKAEFIIHDMNSKEIYRNPPVPFITSTLQQKAQQLCNFGVKRTMQLAQKLYMSGKITYIRTDKPVISAAFVPQIQKYIKQKYGAEYVSMKIKTAKKSKGSQEAHEAIRPTKIEELGQSIKDPLQRKLYCLIWRQTVASCASPSKIRQDLLDIRVSTWNEKQLLQAKAETVLFPGYLKILQVENSDIKWPKLTLGQILELTSLEATEKFSEPPAGFSEASMVNLLEKEGIGRPSTYANSVSVVMDRGYVKKKTIKATKKEINVIQLDSHRKIKEKKSSQEWGNQKNKLFPTDIGKSVNTFIQENFADLFCKEFTILMENKLDQIARGELKKIPTLKEFYKKMMEQMPKITVKKKNQPDSLGTLDDGSQVFQITARYGPCLKVVHPKKKIRFVGIPDDIKLDWDKAKFLCGYPYKLFKIKDDNGKQQQVYLKTGRYGRYIECGKIRKPLGVETFKLPSNLVIKNLF